ncbi:polycystin-1-like [Oratosquilla oratoria]|uniref:polycystin-1-like n=1 Tax=Oratosquilla oratoria TaxID=337810 RepID=UPI003F7726F9
MTSTTPVGILNNESVLDFGTYPTGSLAVELVRTLNVYIKDAGTYDINITLSNKVSSFTFSLTQVLVQEAIREVSGTFWWDPTGEIQQGFGDLSNMFTANNTIIVKPSTDTGWPLKWRVSINDTIEIEEDANTTLSYFAGEDGEYWVVIAGYNTVQGWVESLPLPLIVFFRISGLKVYMEGDVPNANDTATLWASFVVLPPQACVMVDFGDKSPYECYGVQSMCEEKAPNAVYKHELSNPMPFYHTYKEENYYRATILGFDTRGTVAEAYEFLVAYTPCKMPLVWIPVNVSSAALAPSSYKSMPFNIDTKAYVECNKTVPVSREWTISRVDKTTNNPVEDIVIQGLISSWNFSQLSVPPLFLDYGTYKLTYELRLTVSKIFPPLKATAYTYHEVIPSLLRPMMLEGSVKNTARGYGQNQIFYVRQLSSDPDEPESKIANFTYWCRRVTDPPLPMDDKGELTEFNLHPIPVPGTQTGSLGCFGEGPGTIDFRKGKLELEILSFVESEVTYELTVMMSKYGRTATTSVNLEVLKTPPPIVMIKCVDEALCWIHDGVLMTNPSMRIAMLGECLSDCDPTMTYQWSLFDKDGGSINETDDMYITETTAPDLAIAKDLFSLNPGTKSFKFKLTAEVFGAEGYSEVELRVNQPPTSGECFVSPTIGYALISEYAVSCKDWKDPEDAGLKSYMYHYYKETDNGEMKTALVSNSLPDVKLVLPYGTIGLYCDITDIYGATTTIFVGNLTSAMPDQEAIVSYGANAVLDKLHATGDQATLSMVMVALLSINQAVSSVSSDNNLTHAEVMEKLGEDAQMNTDSLKMFAETMSFVSLEGIDTGMSFLNSFMDGVSESKLAAFSLDMEGRAICLELLEKMGLGLDEIQVAAPVQLETILSGSINTVSSLMSVVDIILENNTVVAPTDEAKSESWDYETEITDVNMEVPTDPIEQRRQNVLKTTREKAKQQVKYMMKIIGDITTKVEKKTVPGEQVSATAPNGASITIAKIREQILQKGFEISAGGMDKGRVVFPQNFCPSRYEYTDTDCNKVISITVILWPQLTHSYPESAKLLTRLGSVVTVKIKVDGKPVDVANEKYPITIEIPRQPEDVSLPLRVNTSELMDDLNNYPLIYHYFNVTRQDSGYIFEIEPVDKPLPERLVLLIDNGRLPTPKKYLRCLFRSNFTVENSVYQHFTDNFENGNRTGKFYVGIGVLSDNIDITTLRKNHTFVKKDFVGAFDLDYTFRVITAGCYYFNESLGEWVADGLKINNATNNRTSCSAYHLTSFGLGFFPAPNTINFDLVFANMGFIDNVTLYVTLSVILAFLIVMLIVGRWMDRKDIERRGCHPLPDNLPEDKYLYEITFVTGPDKEASTDSNIQFILSGDIDETGVRTLPQAHDRLYRRYCEDAFVMTTEGPLGNLNYLRIWHDNTGIDDLATWQLHLVVVRDLQNREKFVFEANKWLAFDRDEGAVDVTLNVTIGDSAKGFFQEFYKTGHRGVNDDHMWISMFLKPRGSRFTRVERVLVCSSFLCLSMLTSAMWYERAGESKRNGFLDFGPFTMTWQQSVIGFVSMLIIFPINILFINVFKRARPKRLLRCRALEAIENQRQEQTKGLGLSQEEAVLKSKVKVVETDKVLPKDVSPARCLPWWTRWVCWILIAVCILMSVFLVWAYGIMWGETKTVQWFSSFMISLFLSLLLLQPLKVIFVALASSCCCTVDFSMQDLDCDEELPTLHNDEEWSHRQPRDPKAAKVHDIIGVDAENPSIAVLRTRLRKEREMGFVIKEIFAYVLFLSLLFILAGQNTNHNSFLLQSHLANTFIKKGDLVFDFSERVITADYFWYWARNVILQEIRAQRWYNGKPPYGLRGYLDDRNNRILGYAVLRQVRTKKRGVCRVEKPMDTVIKSCSGNRGAYYEDTRDYCFGWKQKHKGKGACNWDEFKYKSPDETKAFPMEGKLGWYSGGGYMFRLKGSQKSLLKRMQQLQKHRWIDKHTRAVFLEFSVYNVNTNLFSTCLVQAEFNEGGGITPNWRFEPFRLIYTTYDSLVGMFIFVLAILFFTFREAWKIKKQKCEYFASYWNLAELCIIFMSFCAIGMYIYKKILAQEILYLFSKYYGNTYIRLDKAAIVDKIYLYCIGFVGFFSNLKLIKLLQFNKRMNVLALTIKYCWDELKIFFVAFTIVFFAFCCLFFFMFIRYLEEYASFILAVQTCFKMMLGKFDFQRMNRANPLSPILFFVFSVTNSMILINIMLTIILKAFNDVKEELAKKDNKYDVLDFIWYSSRQILRVDPKQLNGVDPNELQKSSKNSTNSEELPDKVSQLMSYIGQMYFDGKVDLNDPKNIHRIMQSANPMAKSRPFRKQYFGRREPIAST